jgi:hypothetical protein
LITLTTFGEEQWSRNCSLCNLLPVWPKYLPQHPILKHPQPVFFLKHDRPSVKPIKKTTGKIIALYVLIFKFLGIKLEDRQITNYTPTKCTIFFHVFIFQPLHMFQFKLL